MAGWPIAVLEPGQLVVELHREGDWARVRFPGGLGWTHGDYLIAADSEPGSEFHQVIEAVNVHNRIRAGWPIAVIFPGQLVEELARQGDRVRVRTAKGIGWVDSDCLGTVSEVSVPAETRVRHDVTTPSRRSLRNTVALNVRTGPRADSWRLDLLYPGQLVEEMEREGRWVKVRFAGGSGWVHGDYLTAVPARGADAKRQLASLDAGSDDAYGSARSGRPSQSSRYSSTQRAVGEP